MSFSMTPILSPNQWSNDDTLYQILIIKPGETSAPGKNIETTLMVKKRGEFKNFILDNETDKKLKELREKATKTKAEIQQQQQQPKNNSISSYLPSLGSCFEKGFMEALFKNASNPNPYHQIELNNFYDVLRTLLHTRKMSQLIARTWDARLKANGNNEEQWECFIGGNWGEINDSDILDGLIARELFLLASSSEPDQLDPKGLNLYNHPPENETGLLIFPTSKAWQGIALSLLMAGQVYYCCDENGTFKEGGGCYHQVSQPILSTGEIVTKYALDVSYGIYKGIIKELDLRANKFSPAYLATLPYPAIPSTIDLSLENIKDWAGAEDVGGKFPFYETKNINGKIEFSIGAKYHTPPFPYLPSSCC